MKDNTFFKMNTSVKPFQTEYKTRSGETVPIVHNLKEVLIQNYMLKGGNINEFKSHKNQSPRYNYQKIVNVKRRIKTKYYSDDKVDRRMYVYSPNVEQYVLPFEEYKKVANKELNRLRVGNFPAWHRIDDEGHLACLLFNRNETQSMKDWCKNTLMGRFIVLQNSPINGYGIVVFEKEIDYIAGILLLGNPKVKYYKV